MTTLAVLPLLENLRDLADDPDLFHLLDPNPTDREWTLLVSSGHVHDVRNESDQPALSHHAYSPRLTTMTRNEVSSGWLVATGVERAGEEW